MPTFQLNAPVKTRTSADGDSPTHAPLQQGDDEEVCCSRTCVGESPSNRLGGDHSAEPWQRTGVVGEGGPAHPDDTLRGVLQPGWRTGSPWLLDRCDEEVGRGSNPHWLLTSNDMYPQ